VHDFVHQPTRTRVVFAPGSRRRLSAEVERLDLHRVILIGGANLLQQVGDEFAEDLGTVLAGRIVDAAQHVPAATAAMAVATASRVGADGIVTLGGGSVIGLAKAVALETGLPILAVPTTYAGSEMTDIWGRTENATKITGRDPRVRPRVVLYDVELTLDMPASLTGISGLNALAHCVEAAYDLAASPITRLLAVEGARATRRRTSCRGGQRPQPRRPLRSPLWRVASRDRPGMCEHGGAPQPLPHPGWHLRPPARRDPRRCAALRRRLQPGRSA